MSFDDSDADAAASRAPIEICQAITDAVSEMWSAFEWFATQGRSGT